MADAGLQAPDIPAPPPPLQTLQQPTQVQQAQQVIHVNWSHFKPEFLGKLGKDPEVHLL